MKRNLIIFFTILLVATAAFFYFNKKQVVFDKGTSLYKAVPVSSPIFVEFSSLNAISQENPILQELTAINDFAWAMDKVTSIKSEIKENKEIKSRLGKKPVILVFDFIGKNVLKPIIISEIESQEELTGFGKLVEKLTGVASSSFKSRKYDGYKIIDVVDANGKNYLHYCAARGLLVISQEALLVEKSIRQLNSHNITNVEYFNQVNRTATSQSNVAWYINHNKFPDLWTNMLNGKLQTKNNEFGETLKTSPQKAIQGIRNYAAWTELDMNFEHKGISLNGVTVANDSSNHFLSVFEGQQAVNLAFHKMLPKNTAYFMGFAFSNKTLFFQRLEKYFEHSEGYFQREKKLKQASKKLRKNCREALEEIVETQVVAAITSISGEAGKQASLFIINNESKTKGRASFESLLKGYAKSKKVDFSALFSVHKQNDGSKYRIYAFPFPSLPSIWLGESFSFVKANYATFWNNNLVFGSSEAVLRKYMLDMQNEQTLRASSAYTSFKQVSESRANIHAYLNVNRAYAANRIVLNKKQSKIFESNEAIFRKFNAIGWQMVCEKNIYFNALHLGYQTEESVDAGALWQSNVGAQLRKKPQIVINHRNKAEKEIIVQDSNNNLHLIDAKGKRLWSVPIKGKILSKIHQIDYYRNGKLQYLFNTKEKLYLIDRNGNKVANFPKIFPSPASNGVNVFDYDNNRKYRYFVACENKKVYAYSHEGKQISGWKFSKTNGAVTTPIRHFRVSSKDYIVFKDHEKIYIQNRQGQTRVNCSAKFRNSDNPLVLNTNGTPKIVATDETGKVYYLFFNGKYAEKKTDKFSKNHFFTVADINGNGIPDFVFVDGKELTVMNEKGKKLFTKKFDNTLLSGANLYSFSAKQKKIGVTDAASNQIYLYNAQGKIHPGFPLAGNSPFSIGKLTNAQLNLVVGDSEGALLNYKLE